MSGFVGERFLKRIWMAHGGTGSGESKSNPLPLASGDLWAIPAGTEIEKVSFLEVVAIGGTTDVDIGDDDAAAGYVDGSVSLNVGTPGLYSNNAKVAGSYLRVETAGATDSADVYVVPTTKYYAAAGKELKAAVTGASSAGEVCVIVEGKNLG